MYHMLEMQFNLFQTRVFLVFVFEATPIHTIQIEKS